MNSNVNELLRSPRKRDFDEAIEALREIPTDQAIQILDELCVDEDFQVRCKGLDGLVRIAPHRAESVGLRMLSDVDPTVRWWAVYWLCILEARGGTRAAVPAIAHLLKSDPDEGVRSEAASVLGEIGNSSILPALEAAATNDQGANHEGVPISSIAGKAIRKVIQREGI